MAIDISVIIPAYNREDSIVRAVNSLLAQTISLPYEVIVVDDGSKDRTVERVEAIQHDAVRLVKQTNKGAAAAREAGVKAAKGTFVAFLDSDDVATPIYLEVMYNKLQATPHALTAFAKVSDMDGEPAEMQILPDLDEHDCVPDSLVALLQYGCFTVSMNLMTRRDKALIAMAGRHHVKAANDYDFCLRLALSGEYVFCDEVTIQIDRRNDGITSRFGFYQVTYAVLGACEAVALSGRQDESIKKALSYRVSKLWPTAFGQCLANKMYGFAWRLFCKGLIWGSMKDFKQVYWSVDHYVFQGKK